MKKRENVFYIEKKIQKDVKKKNLYRKESS
jgi:hypothetical protein